MLALKRTLLFLLPSLMCGITASSMVYRHAEAFGSTQPPPVIHCEKPTMTGDEFMAKLDAIIKHGNLADAAFIEKTLGVKFEVQNGERDGKISPHLFIYTTDVHPKNMAYIKMLVDSLKGPNSSISTSGILHINNNWGGCFFKGLNISFSTFEQKYGDNFGWDLVNDSFRVVGRHKDLTETTNNPLIQLLLLNNLHTNIVEGITLKMVHKGNL